jgi:hypothetical protein
MEFQLLIITNTYRRASQSVTAAVRSREAVDFTLTPLLHPAFYNADGKSVLSLSLAHCQLAFFFLVLIL